MTRAVTLASLADQNIFTADSANDRVGIGSTVPTSKLEVNGTLSATAANISGVVTATQFVGDGSELTGVSGFATALSSDTTSPLNVFFKTPQQVNIGAGISITVESDATSGNIAFIRESIVHVGSGATFHVKTDTTLHTNVLGLF